MYPRLTCPPPPQAAGSGYFELQILQVQNPSGERRDGSCCGDVPRADERCPVPCRTSFRLCLKEYQNPVLTSGLCNFGSISSAVIGGDSFRMTELATNATLRLPFTFSWMVSTGAPGWSPQYRPGSSDVSEVFVVTVPYLGNC